MFDPEKKMNDDEGGPAVGLIIGMKKKKPSFDPDEKLDGEPESGPMDSNAQLDEGCQILARMISGGRVDPMKLKKVLLSTVKAAMTADDEGSEGEDIQ